MKKMTKRVLALALTLLMVFGLLPNFTLPAVAAEQADLTVTGKVADPSSFDNWQDYYGDHSLLPDGSRGISTWKAGGVWTDKSVYANSASFPRVVTMDDQKNNFLIALSALASNKEIVGQSTTPTDTMLVLDLSQSMDNSRSIGDMVAAANETLDTLLNMNINNRVGVVLYSGNHNVGSSDASTAKVILPLDHYTTTSTEQVNGTTAIRYKYLTHTGTSDTTVSVASGTRNSKNELPNTGSKQTAGGTYIQNGLFKAWKEFEGMADKGVVQSGTQAGTQRIPILVLMSDGEPTAATTSYYNVAKSNNGNGTSSNDRIVFFTQLTAAWVKSKAGTHYNNTPAKFYTLGLGTANSANATAVLNPTSSNNTVRGYWNNFNKGSVDGAKVDVDNGLELTYQSAAEAIGRNYVDMYKSAANTADLIEAFKEIVKEIGVQSAYSATLVASGDADLDGYITVEDELGAMMQVKDVKGILLGDTLFTGAELAKSMNEGMLGQSSNPKDYGAVFVQTIKERLGIEDTSVVQDLIRSAYHSKQLNYISASDYSNYIGWYGGANNEYLGFWQESYGYGMESAPAGAVYINKSYCYLGNADHGGVPSDMMHTIVMVHTEITTGHQVVLFRIPSALIPMVEYKVELEGDSLQNATDITLAVEEADPIRLVYEVGLADGVNNINIEQKVAEHLAKGGNHIHKDADGNYVFYANGWDNDHDDVPPALSDLTDLEKLAITEYLPESHFIPNTANERFYVQEDSVVYTKNGNSYSPVTSGINVDGTYYYARTIVTMEGGTARAVAQYELLQPATVANASNFQRNSAGQWEVKAGTIRQHLSNMVLPKDSNNTQTLPNTDQMWVNVTSSDPKDYNVYNFLGNNGKFTVKPATGIKVTKDVTELADGAAADEKFEIQVLLDWAHSSENIAALAVTDTQGNLLESTTYAISASEGDILVTLYLADGESAYITGMPAGTEYTVTEANHDDYTYTYAGATVTVESTIVEGVVTNQPVRPGTLYVTKEVKHGHGEGYAFPTNREFKMKTTFIGKDGQPLANTTFQLENTRQPELTSITTDENGVYVGGLYHGETAHILNIPAGTKVVVEEIEIPVNYTSTTYKSRNQSNTPEDADGEVIIVSQQNATVKVTNTYLPNPTTVDLDIKGTKDFDVELPISAQNAGTFTFVVERWDGSAWVETKRTSLTYAAGEGSSDKTFTFDNVLEGVTFEKIGTYNYQVRELIGTVANVTYDRTLYTFTVTVTDNKGQLEATVTDLNNETITDGSYEVIFTNTYHTAPVSIDITKTVNNLSGSPAVSKAGFKFVVQTAKVDEEGNWSVKTAEEGGRTFSVISDGVGEARMMDVYTQPGTYRYILTEEKTAMSGWVFSEAKYYVAVVVTADDENTGALTAVVTVETDENNTQAETATVNGNYVTVGFTNTYDPHKAEVPVNTLATKKLEGRGLAAGEFNFAIFKDGEASHTDTTKALMLGTNAADGTVSFTATEYGVSQGLVNAANNTLSFGAVGDYYFDVVELSGSKGGVTYDAIIYDMVVEVTDPGADGTLDAHYYYVDDIDQTATFKNTYTALPTDVVIEGKKTIRVNSGLKTLAPGEFTFGLYNEAGEKVGETTNLANGSFKFDAIIYDIEDAGKTYTYTVKEIAPDGTTDGSYKNKGLSWSGQSFTVTVAVIDNGDGTMSTEITGNGADTIGFVNDYNSNPVSVSLPGTKTLEGRDLLEGEFKYAIYKSDSKFEARELVSEEITHDAQGNISFSFGALGMGYHYFVVKEVIPENRAAGIHYDASEYYITIQVTDAGNGQMSYLTTVRHSGNPNVINPDIRFKNIYRPEDGQIDLGGTKTYLGGKALEEDVFFVSLYEGTTELQKVTIKADGSFAFEPLTFTADDIGTHTYTVKEVIPDGATDNGDGTYTSGSDIYDGTLYTVVVTVADENKDGVLEVTKTVNGVADGAISFTNTFVPNPIEHALEATKTYEKGLKGNDFQFRLVSADDKTDVDQTKNNDADGKVAFDPITFTAAGEYKFTVTEKKEGILSFIRPSLAEYEVTVTVVNENGVLKITGVEVINTKGTNESDLNFVNTYVIDGKGEVTLQGRKVLTGDRTTITAGEFAFGLYDAEGKLVESVTNDANGTFKFKTLHYDETDVPVNGQKQYAYTIKEIAGNNARYTYDDTVYTVVVTVKDNDEGGIDVSYTINGKAPAEIEIVFNNVYTDPTAVTYTPVAKKTYNKELTGGEFTFKLEGKIGDQEISQTKKNQAGGAITFDTLSFPEAGTYTFTVKEIEKVLGFIQYSTAEYTIVVEVIDTNGVLSIASVTINDDPNGTIEFVNTYTVDGEGEVTLQGRKVLTGDRTTITAGEFEFGLYEADGTLKEQVAVGADGTFKFQTLHFDETDVPVNGQKQITYTIKEIPGNDPYMTYDDTVYTVVVTVKDNGQGGVDVSYTINGKPSGEVELLFTNTFTKPEPKVASIYIKKIVENKTQPGIGLNDFIFVLEQESGSTHEVASRADGTAGFQISFGYDDIGKTYTFKVYEKKGSTAGVTYDTTVYTVIVKVEINPDGTIKTIINDVDTNGIELAFTNIYEKPETPVTGDDFPIIMLGGLMVISALAIVMLMLTKKKKGGKYAA